MTVTAPSGRQHNRFIPGRRGRHGECLTCSRDSDVYGLANWNAGESACWNRLMTRLRREGGIAYFSAVEVQELNRHALHRHVLLVMDRRADVGRLHDWATAAGYGCTFDLEPLVPGSRKAARYVAKYVSKSCDARAGVPWLRQVVDEMTGEIEDSTAPTYRTWSSSRTWGITMREVVAASRLAVSDEPEVMVPWLRPVAIPCGVGDSG